MEALSRYTTVILLAGGSGSRMGEATPKQLLPILGKPLLYHTVSAFAKCPLVDALVVVSRKEDMEQIQSITKAAAPSLPLFWAEGGKERMHSAFAGLAKVPAQTEFVAIHDVARCLIHPEDIEAVLMEAYQKGSATLVKPMTDTIKRKTADHTVEATIDRTALCAAQTPQVFQKAEYEATLTAALADGASVTDDNSLFERLGKSVPLVESRHENEKITFKKDISYAEYILTTRQKGSVMKQIRIGHGYDVHRLALNRDLIIGGVKIPHKTGLDGHSDADVLVHAIMDALLGAAGLPNIGKLFPDTSAAFKDISSLLLLSKVKDALAEAGYAVGNIDATIVAQAPKMAPHIPEMKQKIAATLGCSEDVVNVKATTEEKLGFTGSEEGIAAHAVCLLYAV